MSMPGFGHASRVLPGTDLAKARNADAASEARERARQTSTDGPELRSSRCTSGTEEVRSARLLGAEDWRHLARQGDADSVLGGAKFRLSVRACSREEFMDASCFEIVSVPMELRRRAARPRESRETRAILDDLRRIVQVLRESSRAAEAELGVSGAQLFVLRALAAAPALSLSELTQRTHTHQSTVSVVVKRLVRHKFVRRRASDSDRRRVELELTQAGRGLLERAPLAAQDRLIGGLARLERDERRTLASGLRRLVTEMQLAHTAPAMFFEDAPADGARERPGHARA
jgi:DNA-binding MarR family transcriptional regulator